MRKIWESAGAMRALATGLLVFALAGIAATFHANGRWVAIQGPVTLQAVDDGTLWLGVNEDVWILDSRGRREGRRSARELGLTAAPSNMALAPSGQVLLASRVDRDWQLVERKTLAHVRTIRPQWPQDIADLPLNAVHLAVSPGGHVAAATGGGHTVLLFDREGRLLGRTAPDTYHFTNGLWWSPQGWWTTDTNRFALRLLDARTLAVKADLPLRRAPPATPFLGEAMASQGLPLAGGTDRPLATLTRLGRRMEPGHAVDIFPDGSQAVYNPDTIRQLRDMVWFDKHLLLVDGERFEVRRFGPDRGEVEPFGDAQVRAELARLREDRAFWRGVASRQALTIAALLLVLGLLAYARHRQLAGRAHLSPEPEQRLPRRAWQPALASFVVPGTGQWLQGRFVIGTVLFTAALLLCIYGWAPVLWALHGPKMEVSRHAIAQAFVAWLLAPLVASSEAWKFGSGRR